MILNNESTVMNNVICQRTSMQSQLPDPKKGKKKFICQIYWCFVLFLGRRTNTSL